ncbi:DUF6473 family protein [Aliiroseovarius marinus]|uniref:DUF6473 family protein n=1 Tax=Aliiroseovarius marinus TaxID=2500159 RepID=UPI003D7D8F94
MAYEKLDKEPLDYLPCRYGASKILFRGPKRSLDGDYIVALGGTETYGRFMERPYPAILEQEAGVKVINMGCQNAGLDVFLNDQSVLDACNGARATVIQIPGAANMSNRFYAVHPRRNDRFLRASNLLKAIYREVDFTEFNFTRHLLTTLKEISEDRFAMVEQELREAWVARMKTLIPRVRSRVVLLWLADHPISQGAQAGLLGPDPLFVDEEMINEVRPFVHDICEVVVSPEEIEVGKDSLLFAETDRAAADQMLGSVAHLKASHALEAGLLDRSR